ncbi:MAG: macro domain-containing protein [Lachnospiraceae bacterium]|nr:macro domain-containing protein [Lachnospiraceae bacterium]
MFSHKNKPVREEDDEDSKPAAKPAEKPAAKAPEKPAEVKKDAAKPAEKAPQKPAEPKKEAAKPAEKAPQKPAEPKKEAAKPAEKAPEKPAEPKKEAVKPAEKAPQKPAEPKKEAAKPAETEPQKPAEVKKEAAKPKEAAAAAKAPAAKPRTYRDDVRSEIVIKHGNIVTLSCDAIVNGTNQTLLGGPGIDNTILKAGGPELLRECAALKGCDVGRAKISRGYRLKAQFVIHTVGPKYSGDDSDPVYLTMCYENCLNLAMKYDLHSVAFPPISTGYFGYPLREAAMIASRTVQSWMRRHPEYSIKVIFVSADERTFAMYREILSGKK